MYLLVFFLLFWNNKQKRLVSLQKPTSSVLFKGYVLVSFKRYKKGIRGRDIRKGYEHTKTNCFPFEARIFSLVLLRKTLGFGKSKRSMRRKGIYIPFSHRIPNLEKEKYAFRKPSSNILITFYLLQKKRYNENKSIDFF